MHSSLSFCFINIFASFSYSFSFLGIIKLRQKITGLKGIDYKKKQRYFFKKANSAIDILREKNYIKKIVLPIINLLRKRGGRGKDRQRQSEREKERQGKR